MRRTVILAPLLAAACLLPLCACGETSQNTPNPQQQNASEQVEVLDRAGEKDDESEAEAEDEPTQEPDAENAPEAEADPEPEPEPEPADANFDATAPVVTSTSESGISVTAPNAFLATSAFAQVEDKISALVASGYHVGVVMRDLTTGNQITYNTDERLYPASSIKAPYCAMVCETNGGSGAMSQTMENCLVNSSNEDYEALINAYGMPAFGAWIAEHGAPEASADGSIWWYPEISAGELAALWEEIYRYGTSGEAGGAELAGYLARTESSPIGDTLRETCEVWSKPGWFPDNGELVATNDAGVVFSESGTYVMVIMTSMSSNLDGLVPLVEALDNAHSVMCRA